MNRLRKALSAIGVLVLLLLACQRTTPHATPEAKAAYTELTQENFPRLKESFNAASEETRILAFLSPT